jgi:hypothetical protein
MVDPSIRRDGGRGRRLAMSALVLLLGLAVCQTAAPGAEPAQYGKTDGLIPGVIFGPKLSLRLPTPAVGVEVKVLNLLGLSFDYGMIPELEGDVDTTSYSGEVVDWSVAAKVYPFRGRFFVGAALGKRTVSATAEDLDPLLDETGGAVDVDVTYLAPELGWRWTWASGFFLGMEFAWQLPLSDSVRYSADMTEQTKLDLEDAVDIARGQLPSVALLQVGWFL